MLDTGLNIGNRAMSKRDMVPAEIGRAVLWETDTKGRAYESISGRRITQAK